MSSVGGRRFPLVLLNVHFPILGTLPATICVCSSLIETSAKPNTANKKGGLPRASELRGVYNVSCSKPAIVLSPILLELLSSLACLCRGCGRNKATYPSPYVFPCGQINYLYKPFETQTELKRQKGLADPSNPPNHPPPPRLSQCEREQRLQDKAASSEKARLNCDQNSPIFCRLWNPNVMRGWSKGGGSF